MITSYTTVEWGVLHTQDLNFRKAGQVESGGTRPGGDVGPFDEGMCRYISGSFPGSRVVSRTVTVTTETSDWE